MPDIKHVTLVAATPQTVALDSMYYSKIEVLNRGDVEAFARQDGERARSRQWFGCLDPAHLLRNPEGLGLGPLSLTSR
jgi:hypothetical protein